MYDPSSPFVASAAPFRPSHKAEFAEQRLRAAIQWCELAPGERVGEQDLVDRFGLGRAGVRVALSRLAVSGLVEPVPRAGWRVQPITGAMIGHVIEARRLVEPVLGGARLTSEREARARELIGIVGALADPGERGEARSSAREYEREALELVRAGVNPFVGGLLKDLWDRSERIVRALEMKGAEPFRIVDAAAFLAAVLTGESAAVAEQRAADVDRFEKYVTACLLRDDTAIAVAAPTEARPSETGEPNNNGKENQTGKWEPGHEKYME